MALTARNADGAEVRPGEIVNDHRGTPWVFVGATDRTEPGRSGKVLVAPEDNPVRRRQFYAHVFDLTVSEA